MLSFVALVLAVTASVSVSANCEGGCNLPFVHYKDVGCTAVYANPSDCCPSYFNCPDLEERSPDKCYVKGHVFNKKEEIPASLTVRHCLTSCFCSNRGLDLDCALIECPVYEEGLEEGCYLSYSSKECCPKKICPPFDNIAKCVVNGTTYHEGELWSTNNRNIQCECKPEQPFCTEITSCGIELAHSRDIQNKCAPVFYGPGGCPIYWECFAAGDVIVPNTEGTTSEQKCTYGNKKLNIGDKLVLKRTSSRAQVDCKCEIPPFVSCIKKQ